MTSIRALLVTTLTLMTAVPVATQTYALDKCDKHAVPVGFLRASGTVRYTLRKDGTAGVDSLAVLTVDGMSVNGFQSAAARQVGGCKMHRPGADLLVTQVIRFDSITVALEPATAAAGSVVAIPLAQAPIAGTTPLAANDSTLEERPRWITCTRPPKSVPAGPSGPSQGAQDRAFLSASPLNAGGSITVRVIVGADGLVDKDHVVLINSSNPQTTSNLLRAMRSCKYTPARIGGTPIATTFVAGMIASGGGYTVTDLPIVTVLNGTR